MSRTPWFARITLMALFSFALAGVFGFSRADANINLKLGFHAPPAPIENLDALRDLERSIGHEADILSIYQGWGNGGWAAVQPEWLERASGNGERDVLITWEPWVAGGPYSQPEYHLSTIVDGRHDDYIRSWARDLRTHGRRIYLRPMHEMNGHWYPWAGGIAGNTPELYIAAWRRMHHIFAQEGATNVRWVWTPMAYEEEPESLRFEQFYPGDDVVDILGLDGYNWGTREPNFGGWRSFDRVFRDAYKRLARVGTQPIWITEAGSATEGGNKARWIRDALRKAGSGRYSRLGAVVWFNIDKERDWRANSSPDVARAFQTELTRLERRRDRLGAEFRRNARSVDRVLGARRAAARRVALRRAAQRRAAFGSRNAAPRFRSGFESAS